LVSLLVPPVEKRVRHFLCNGIEQRAVNATYRGGTDPRAKQAVSRPKDDRKKQRQHKVRSDQVLCAVYKSSMLLVYLNLIRGRD